jgi:hypothetical protein
LRARSASFVLRWRQLGSGLGAGGLRRERGVRDRGGRAHARELHAGEHGGVDHARDAHVPEHEDDHVLPNTITPTITITALVRPARRLAIGPSATRGLRARSASFVLRWRQLRAKRTLASRTRALTLKRSLPNKWNGCPKRKALRP